MKGGGGDFLTATVRITLPPHLPFFSPLTTFSGRKRFPLSPEMPHVTAILIASEAGAPMQRVAEARAVAGEGLEGDRYERGVGSFSRWPGAHRALTLIAEEALAAFEAETGVALSPEEARRNVVVRGVPLNDLVGVRFQVGEVEVQGARLCQPCKALARRTDKPEVLPERDAIGARLRGPGAHSGLVGKGGLRAAILTGGVIRVGDTVEWDTGTAP